jgi:SAM-dependent methyltransferase
MAGGSDRVHPAARGFDPGAEAYERGRPEYPPEALACLIAGLGLGPRSEVLELASGTGKLTRGLLATGARIVAIEPSPGMRRAFAAVVPGVEVLDGTAESIPRPDASADAVVVGQAFHWFRPAPTLSEVRRVLRPGGGLGLVWNRRDESVPWVEEFGRTINRHRPAGTPDSSDRSWQAAFDAESGFAPLETFRFRFEHEESIEQVVDRAVSVSFVALQPVEVRERLAEEVRAFLSQAPETRGRATVRFPYRTEVYVTHRVVRSGSGARASHAGR